MCIRDSGRTAIFVLFPKGRIQFWQNRLLLDNVEQSFTTFFQVSLKKEGEKMDYIGFRISEEDKEQFVALAMEKGLSISALMRILVREYLKGETHHGL